MKKSTGTLLSIIVIICCVIAGFCYASANVKGLPVEDDEKNPWDDEEEE